GASVHIRLAPAERAVPDPRFLHQGFAEDRLRQAVLEALVPGAQVTLAGRGETPHYRALEATLRDGRRLRVLLDQGFGFWRVAGTVRHDFHAPPEKQAQSLRSAEFAIAAGPGNAPVAVVMSDG
ncbi:MAG: hypothetical protein D6832_02580, partial [Alphaproteobacteria bacterium]